MNAIPFMNQEVLKEIQEKAKQQVDNTPKK
jgi:hypothetical protein